MRLVVKHTNDDVHANSKAVTSGRTLRLVPKHRRTLPRDLQRWPRSSNACHSVVIQVVCDKYWKINTELCHLFFEPIFKAPESSKSLKMIQRSLYVYTDLVNLAVWPHTNRTLGCRRAPSERYRLGPVTASKFCEFGHTCGQDCS